MGTVYATFYAMKRWVRKDWPCAAEMRQGVYRGEAAVMVVLLYHRSSETLYRPGRGDFREAKA